MRTNKLYNVQVAKYAWMAVEASSPLEAMEIASGYIDEYPSDDEFEDTEVEIASCESYSRDIDDYDDEQMNIFTKDEVMTLEEYEQELYAQEL